ncbi:MAG: beta-propeller domain-containing protein [Propionicimonas sp.]|nr:beta-propeller domain-containing protein [Propionicimonas sp.]
MNDGIFSEMSGQMRPDEQTRSDLFAAIAADEAPAPGPVTERRRGLRVAGWLLGAASVALAVSLAVVPGLTGRDGLEVSDPPRVPAPAPADVDTAEAAAGEVAGDYAQLYTAVRAAATRGGGLNGWYSSEDSAGGRNTSSAAAAPVPNATADGGSWQTNSQVAGIDEADVVKSDGHTLFIASGKQVVLVSAAGDATGELARIDTGTGPAAPQAKDGEYVVQGPVVDLMVDGSTLVVLVTEYHPRVSEVPASVVTTFVPFDAGLTKALLYDISNPAAPKFRTSLGQSGAYLTSRLAGDLLYLVTEYILTDPEAIDPDDPETFVPLVSDGTARSAIGASDCVILPFPDGPRYAVASSLDLAAGKRIDTESVLGGSQTVYMSNDNLYLAAADYEAPMSAKQRKAAKVDDLREVYQTRLTRIALADGELTLAGQGSVPGNVLNQFALDEYGGHLRVAVTISGDTGKGAWVNRPALYVFDSDLKVVGSLPELAKNETVQSVRFDGPVGYVVSFERVDPLFALDLAKPAEPAVMSALKIPGFSTYLHPWGDGRLLGLGMNADSEGQVSGMKLSMFDTSDPFDVTEQATRKVAFDDAEALANHKAVLVDTGRGLIGFAAVSWRSNGEPTQRYLVYRYGADGFDLAEKLPLQAAADGNVTGIRGLTIDDYLYVASAAGVDVYRADSLDKVAGLGLGR